MKDSSWVQGILLTVADSPAQNLATIETHKQISEKKMANKGNISGHSLGKQKAK